jgi:hypothetical protein
MPKSPELNGALSCSIGAHSGAKTSNEAAMIDRGNNPDDVAALLTYDASMRPRQNNRGNANC